MNTISKHNLQNAIKQYLLKVGQDQKAEQQEDTTKPADAENKTQAAATPPAAAPPSTAPMTPPPNQFVPSPIPSSIHFLHDPYWYERSAKYEEAARQWIKGILQQPDKRAQRIYRFTVSPFEGIDLTIPPPLVVHPSNAWQAYQKYLEANKDKQPAYRFVDFLFPTYDIRNPPIVPRSQ